ncbi:MAG: TetR/AcrR family transcriptional regulator [Rubricoccaceae bacterium]
MSESPKPRGRPRTLDRQRTIQVAMESYWREGLHALSLNEVCRRTGVSKPGLYREFGGEDGLMDAALTHYATTVLEPVLAMLSEDRPFQDTLDSLVDFATREADPERPAGCLFAKMRGVRWRLGPATSDHVDELRKGAVEAYSAWLDRSVRQGQIELSVPVEVAATYVDAQLTMLATQAAAGEDRERGRAHATLAFASLTQRLGVN